MNRILFLMLLALTTLLAAGQEVTPAVTVYKQFQPASIRLSDGRLLKVSLANIFLKNSALLYKSGVQTKEANMGTIESVAFEDRTYYKIDSLLAYQVDSVGDDALYCAKKIDFVAYRQLLANNRDITSLSLGDMVGFTTTELQDEQDIHFPIIPVFYYRLNGRYVLVHERQLRRVLSKEKRRLMESVMAVDGFSWTDEKSLMTLLRAIR